MSLETTEGETKRQDSQVPIREGFALESRITASISGQAFKAIERRSRLSLGLWISRWPLREPYIDQFLRRAADIARAGSQPSLLSFGLDAEGYGWATFKLLSGRNILEGKLEGAELERRCLGCIRAIAGLHRAGMRCGDVSLDSFFMTTGGEPRFIGGFGLLLPPEEVAALPEDPELAELLAYLSPEQRQDRGETAQGDVFSLAMLAYRLFLGHSISNSFPSFGKGSDVALPAIPGAPAWMRTVIEPILSGSAQCRPKDADDLTNWIIQARMDMKADAAAATGGESRRSPSLARQASSVVAVPSGAKGAPRRNRKLALVAAVGATALVGVFLGAFGRLPFSAAPSGTDGPVAGTLLEVQGTLQQKVDTLSRSDDPMAHESLLRLLKDCDSAEERRLVVNGTLARVRRLGLIRSADLVRGWFASDEHKALTDGVQPPALKAVNPSLAVSLRAETLRRAYDLGRSPTAQLASALALDGAGFDPFREIFVSAAKDVGGIPDAGEHSTKAAVLSVPAVRALYLGDLLDAVPPLSAVDTAWLVRLLGTQGDSQVRRVAALGLQSGTYSGPQRVFAEVLSGGVALSSRERWALVAALSGSISQDTVSSLVASYYPEASKALLATMFLSQSPDVRLSAFDGLATKPISDPYLRGVMQFVRANRASERANYLPIMASIGLQPYLTEQEFNRGFAGLAEGAQPKIADSQFINVLLSNAPPRVVFEVVRIRGSSLEAGVLLDLLSSPYKEVRIEALNRLNGINDATAVTYIRQRYQDETDPEVRQKFQALFFPQG